MHSKVLKNQQKQQESENKSFITTAIVIPKELTSPEVHRAIEEYQTDLRFTKDPKITKPGAAYELIKLGIEVIAASKTGKETNAYELIKHYLIDANRGPI